MRQSILLVRILLLLHQHFFSLRNFFIDFNLGKTELLLIVLKYPTVTIAKMFILIFCSNQIHKMYRDEWWPFCGLGTR